MKKSKAKRDPRLDMPTMQLEPWQVEAVKAWSNHRDMLSNHRDVLTAMGKALNVLEQKVTALERKERR